MSVCFELARLFLILNAKEFADGCPGQGAQLARELGWSVLLPLRAAPGARRC